MRHWLLPLFSMPLLVLLHQLGAYRHDKREITWQQFVHDLLATGRTAKLVVLRDRGIVLVYVCEPIRDDDGGGGGGGDDGDGERGHESRRVTANEPEPQYIFAVPDLDLFERNLEAAQRALGRAPEAFVSVEYRDAQTLADYLLDLLPALAVVSLWMLLTARIGRRALRGGGTGASPSTPFVPDRRSAVPEEPDSNPFTLGRARAHVVDGTAAQYPRVRFADVAGMEEAKREVGEFVDYLRTPQRFTELGAHIPKGALLSGPPGTGKTLLARAVAGEAGVPFLVMAGPEFVEMVVGVGPARVRDLFAQARQRVPCIIYIDEIDAIGRARGGPAPLHQYGGGNSERENTLNQLLVEMDGFSTTGGVVLLASTNRPDILDPALLRPGRFDRRIAVELPDMSEREAIFLVHLRPLKLELPTTAYAKRMAELTPGFSGADIANVCNEAALHAARYARAAVGMEDLQRALDRVVAGPEKRSRALSVEERRVVAYHEAGHAVVGWMLRHAEPLLKVSIVPHGAAALGYAQHLPLDLKIYSREQLFDRICVGLAGRVAERLLLGRISTGAVDDLSRVTKLAYSEVSKFGMSLRIGPVAFEGLSSGSRYGRRPYSDRLGACRFARLPVAHRLLMHTDSARD